jgi:hypothetical protein
MYQSADLMLAAQEGECILSPSTILATTQAYFDILFDLLNKDFALASKVLSAVERCAWIGVNHRTHPRVRLI